ncbi:MAG: hypothetical protein ACOZAO_01480 [Patescibacteria group bacterium]
MDKEKSKKRSTLYKAFGLVLLLGFVLNFFIVGFTKPGEIALQYDFSIEYDAALAEDLHGISYPNFSGDMGTIQDNALAYEESDTFAAYNETRVLVEEPTCEADVWLIECDMWVLKEADNLTPAIYYIYGNSYVGKIDGVSIGAYRLDKTSLHFEGSILKGTYQYHKLEHIAAIVWVWVFSALLVFLLRWFYQITFGSVNPNFGPDML